jgi:DNA processing protein
LTPAEEASLAAWLRLTLVPGVGGETQRLLLSRLGLPHEVFAAGSDALARLVPDKLVRGILTHDASAETEAALAWAREPGNAIVTLADGAYPQRLLQTPDPPTLLYVKGRVELLNQPALAIVGSRNATAQGSANAEAFADALAQAGLTVISGLALGIDAAAHRGALRGGAHGASTLAVIGTGIDRVYPARNRELAQQIAEAGAIVSEFPLGTPAISGNFPRRNRIISGMALGVLVVEAAQRSGSLITARLAGDQGREVFAIPGSIHSPLSKGCHQLIKQGAKLADDARDILDELGLQGGASAAVPDPVPEDVDRLLAALGYDPCDMDTLAVRAGLSADAIAALLLQLELDGRVARLPGGRFQRLG